MRFKRRGFIRSLQKDIAPDEIFLDAQNAPAFDTYHMEGRIERPIGTGAGTGLAMVCFLIITIFLGRAGYLQVVEGASYREQSERNRLDGTIVFAERGVITDRNGMLLAWNEPPQIAASSTDHETLIARRRYYDAPGFAHVLGYVNYPLKDSSGFYYQEEIEGGAGAESDFNVLLAGKNGRRLVESTAQGEIVSEALTEPAINGEPLVLSIDARVQEALYDSIRKLAEGVDFEGGAGVVLDVHTGEVIAMASFPEFDPQVFSDRDEPERIREYLASTENVFLNRAIAGQYTPGSIVKPFMALGALTENIIDPSKKILSTGSISIPNPYFPDKPSIFRDWKAHGWVNMREALMVSSDVYFYEIGGGFEGQKGLGIDAIDRYMRLFGLGSETGINLSGEVAGVIPTPDWKEEVFNGDPWRLGDTYNTSIGQYGFQVTPVQMARAVAAIANGGILVLPTILHDDTHEADGRIAVTEENFGIVREGMRMAVTDQTLGTARGLSLPYVAVAGKTGTAELGISKKFVNSWVMGFFPYEAPRYAFAVVMERGPVTNLVGATFAMRQTLEKLHLTVPELLK